MWNVLVRARKKAQIVVARSRDDRVIMAVNEIIGDPCEVLPVDRWLADIDVVNHVQLCDALVSA